MRKLLVMIGLLALAACARDDLTEQPEPLGDFRLGHNVVFVGEPQQGPFSRTATNAQWEAAMTKAVADRFNETRFFGDRFFHIGVAVEGYVLAQPGIPLVYSPRSVLIFSVNFFEDATQTRLNEEPIQITVFEACCSVPLLGSGLTKSAEEQMEALSFNAARAIERTMRENAQWFGGTPEILDADDTIVTGNVLIEDPDLIAPPQEDPTTN